MQSRIPLPTDNIYKFYAFFGLLLFITGILGTIFVSTSTNEKLYELVKDYESIPEELKSSNKSTLAEVIEKRIEIQASNKHFFLSGLGVLIAISIYLMFYGFKEWHTKIQPKQDELFQLQLEKLRKEVEKL